MSGSKPLFSRLFFDIGSHRSYYSTFAGSVVRAQALRLEPGPRRAESTVNQGPGSERKTRFDAFKLAADGGTLSGDVDARTLDRAVDRLAPGSGEARIRWRIAGGHDALQRPALTVAIEGTFPLVCQRCLQVFGAPIVQETRLLLARDEAELRRLDTEESEVVLAATPLDARVLVEDEVVLSLPFAPHHPDGECSPGRGWAYAADDARRHGEPSPFAPLARLKKRR